MQCNITAQEKNPYIFYRITFFFTNTQIRRQYDDDDDDDDTKNWDTN